MRSHFSFRIPTVVGLGAALLLLLALTFQESAAAPYYEGKTITIVRGGAPGGTGERQAITVVPFLKNSFPEAHL